MRDKKNTLYIYCKCIINFIFQQEEAEVDPELAKYLNRKRWELRQSVLEEHSSRADVTSPSAPNISSPMPQKVIITKQQNGEVDNQMEEFVNALRSQVEIFVNRMKSNSSRGRSIANDSSVQTLFLNITAMHSRFVLKNIFNLYMYKILSYYKFF